MKAITGSMEETIDSYTDKPYGPGDNYNKETSHVLPTLVRRFMKLKLINQEML